jgi:hypothetical protein
MPKMASCRGCVFDRMHYHRGQLTEIVGSIFSICLVNIFFLSSPLPRRLVPLFVFYVCLRHFAVIIFDKEYICAYLSWGLHCFGFLVVGLVTLPHCYCQLPHVVATLWL